MDPKRSFKETPEMHRPLTVTVLLLPCTLSFLACNGDLTVAENGRDGGMSPGTGEASIEDAAGGASDSTAASVPMTDSSAPLLDASTAFDALPLDSALPDVSAYAGGPFDLLY